MHTIHTFTLHRLTDSDEGTFGIFSSRDVQFSCISLELPDRDNTPMLSRIPAGTYRASWSWSARFKRKLYRLAAVPGRAGILIHPANFAGDIKLGWESELSGCIALGRTRETLRNLHGLQQSVVTNSRATVTELEVLLAAQPFTLHVTDTLLTANACG